MKILAHAGDRGGYNALKPVLELALQEGHDVVDLFLSETSARQRQAGTLPLVAGLEPSRILINQSPRDFSIKHDVSLIGASQSEEGSIAAVEFILYGSPALIVEDYYGSSLPTLNLLPRLKHEFPHVCVSDEVSRDNVYRIIPFGFCSYVHVTGMPQYHDLISRIKPDWEKIRAEIRSKLDIPKGSIVALIAGQLNGTAEAIAALNIAANKLNLFIFCLVRQHPRATKTDRLLTRWSISQVDEDESYNFLIVSEEFINKCLPSSLTQQTETLLPAADFVISGYSTTLRFAAMLGITGTISLGTPGFAYDLKREKNLDVSPEVAAGAVWHARDANELANAISLALEDPPGEEASTLKEKQAQLAALNDDQATRRILDIAINMAK